DDVLGGMERGALGLADVRGVLGVDVVLELAGRVLRAGSDTRRLDRVVRERIAGLADLAVALDRFLPLRRHAAGELGVLGVVELLADLVDQVLAAGLGFPAWRNRGLIAASRRRCFVGIEVLFEYRLRRCCSLFIGTCGGLNSALALNWHWLTWLRTQLRGFLV